ncbi:MAG: imidazole glycerol phosphate synthase subunit HisH [Candidatus Omnitrophota bacterium]|jgi:glutamine amidotransferase|nr:MAG: imidazole glycerol phosphate synthase subunit HisH [Candidatus Omnitrophota bacterium]
MIAIIDYEAGNLTSVLRAVRRLGFDAVITQNANVIDCAERLIFPGVGAAGAAMEVLRRTGLDELVTTQVQQKKKPFLAICIGIQIIFEHSDEDDVDCLGLLQGNVKRFADNQLKIPQIGWNQVYHVRDHPIFHEVPDQTELYFVNSYYCEPADRSVVIGETDYGIRFTSAVAKDNMIATQFHLEKSGPVGLRMLKNFCEWQP